MIIKHLVFEVTVRSHLTGKRGSRTVLHQVGNGEDLKKQINVAAEEAMGELAGMSGGFTCLGNPTEV